jgi:hypothetical protein
MTVKCGGFPAVFVVFVVDELQVALAAKNGCMHSQNPFPEEAQTLVALLFKNPSEKLVSLKSRILFSSL